MFSRLISGDWFIIPPKFEAKASDGESRIRIVTYNIWFDGFEWERRTQGLIDVLKAANPDVICLQEVTPRVLSTLMKSYWIRKNFVMSDSGNFSSVHPYGVLILSRYPAIFHFIEFKTQMHRKLVVAEANINGQKLAFGSVHLESMDSAPIRKLQYMKAHEHLLQYDGAILVGDFNMCSTRDFKGPPATENKGLMECFSEYVDVWPFLVPDQEGFTHDGKANGMIRHKYQKRLDRILSRSASWAPVSVSLVGVQPLDSPLNSVWISDHFGLLAEFEFNPALH
eukprot:TRINITY_DN5646_c0_g1_i2.p1 TRINITY_DN5646_c0_g1~~TRINITY_DN5646_c0_g1_i2.p1  ORF type:complete len:282 (+),score=47.54 TRINITY_DN5646_c0_g1_i2:86-931(+)